ncbi:MAG: SulP family inorganic anion transporter [Myxococcota bacterium]
MADAKKTGHPVWLTDTLAALVVFLVALPLCIGIAVACGVPAERGLLTGIVGGIIVGTVSGAPLLVSGPAASLIVPVYQVVEAHGAAALAPVVMLAGLWQALAGFLKLGQWFRAVAPAVIKGMLIGIGVLIFGSQLHVAIDGDPKSSFVQNIATFPGALYEQLTGGVDRAAPLLVLVATIVLLVGWTRFRPKKLELVPGHLIALVSVTVASALLAPPLRFLDISSRFLDGIDPVGMGDFSVLADPAMFGQSLVFAFVASAATLLTATAIDQKQSHTKTHYDREMLAQGLGNFIAGGLGGLPMTGVIVRSSVNVDAGARTRMSTIVHGFLLLAFVSVAPQLLELIPRASLGAILVYTGYKLIDVKGVKELWTQGRAEFAICLVTLAGVVFIDLFVGIMAGFAAAIAKVVYTFTHLQIRHRVAHGVHRIELKGSATFLRLPQLAQALDSVRREHELRLDIEQLDHIDHACLELLSSWSKTRENEGLPGMLVEWDKLTHRYQKAVQGTREEAPSRSMLRIVWAEWKRIYRQSSEVQSSRIVPQRWIEPDRVHAGLRAGSLDEVIARAAALLAPHAPLSERALRDTLLERVEGHIALGHGVSLPHAPIAGLKRPVAALITTVATIAVEEDEVDVFFVLLAPEGDPQVHLKTLAHVGRLCHDPELLTRLRGAVDDRAIVEALVDAEDGFEVASPPTSGRSQRVLALIEVDHEEAALDLAAAIEEGFERPQILAPKDGVLYSAMSRCLHIVPGHHLVVLQVDDDDWPVLRALTAECTRLLPGETARLHQLRPDEVDDLTRPPSFIPTKSAA